MTILDIARQEGLHPNTVRFHLNALAESGRVETVEPAHRSPGRPPLLFRARRGMDPAGPRNYQLLAEALATRLGADRASRDKAVEAGRTWGAGLVATTPSHQVSPTDAEATERLVGTLGDLGFSPRLQTSAGETEIGLRHCPFLDLVPDHEDVICPVHLGLMQGVLGAMGAGVTVDRLEPFAEPDLCVAHMTSTDTKGT
jgi:predicted ArsR family transcriptional regulator